MAEAAYTFPQDFLWGTATSAHQVEGGNTNNDWWAWEQRGGVVFENHTSGAACEWWSGRAEEDIQRMAALNTNAHRLSVEWSRIEPREGQWNYAALDRYRAILRAMRDAGITPMVTLHHFTNPLWVAHRGGWLHPDAPQWFARFVEKVVSDLADLVTLWCTINEPDVYAGHGYVLGKWPPGATDLAQYFRVVRHLLLAHARAYAIIHDFQPGAQVGLAKHIMIVEPLTASLPDRLVARTLDHAFNGIILNALATGEWRPLLARREQIDALKGTLDWIGVNYYQREAASFSLKHLYHLAARPGVEKGPAHWGELYAAGLYESIRRLHGTLNIPVYVTETGVPDEHDRRRPAWIMQSLRHVWRAINFNIPVRGYFFWSLMDNFEWAEGYDPRFRFGLYGIDFETQERTLRQSGALLAEIAGTGALTTDMARRYAPGVVEELFPGRGPEGLHATR